MWPFSIITGRRKAAPAAGSIPFVDAATWSRPIGGTTSSISATAVEALATGTACISLISETISALPMSIVRNDGTRQPLPNHPLARLIAIGPSPSLSWSSMVADWIASMLANGNGVVRCRYDRSGTVVGLQPIAWSSLTPQLTEQGELIFDVVNVHPPKAGERERLYAGDYLLLRERGNGSSPLGVSKIQRAAAAMQAAVNLQASTTAFDMNSVRPSGTLRAPGKISKETSDRLAQDWDSAFAGARTGKTAVLPEGLEWAPLSKFSADDLQIVERLRWSSEEVCRTFGVPASMVDASAKASTYASAREASTNFLRSLAPIVRRVEETFAPLLEPARAALSIDTSALLRLDPASMADGVMKLRQSSVISPNDGRSMIGLPASSDELADSLAPPNTSSAAITGSGDTTAPADVPEEPDADDAPTDKAGEIVELKTAIRRHLRARRA